MGEAYFLTDNVYSFFIIHNLSNSDDFTFYRLIIVFFNVNTFILLYDKCGGSDSGYVTDFQFLTCISRLQVPLHIVKAIRIVYI